MGTKRKTLTMDRAIEALKPIYREAEADSVSTDEITRQLSEMVPLISDPLVSARLMSLIDRMKENVERTRLRAGKLRDIVTLGEPDNWRTMAQANGIHVPGDENEKP